MRLDLTEARVQVSGSLFYVERGACGLWAKSNKGETSSSTL